jgi:hypothetical protein
VIYTLETTGLECENSKEVNPLLESNAVSNPITGLDRPLGLQEVETPRFLDNRHMKVLRLSTLRTGCLYPPENIPGTHFCYRLSRSQGHSATERIMSMKNSDTFGNRTRNLPACSAVQISKTKIICNVFSQRGSRPVENINSLCDILFTAMKKSNI